MGTVFSIDIRDEGTWTAAIDAVVAWLQHVDAVFSTYKQDSDISRIGRGELLISDAHPDVTQVLDVCRATRGRNHGLFQRAVCRPTRSDRSGEGLGDRGGEPHPADVRQRQPFRQRWR